MEQVGKMCPQCANTMFSFWEEYFGRVWRCEDCDYAEIEDLDVPDVHIYADCIKSSLDGDIPLGGE